MERTAKIELVEVLRERYQRSTKVAKSRILDELVEITGYHRKYALRLLRQPSTPRDGQVPGRRRIYNAAVKPVFYTILLEVASHKPLPATHWRRGTMRGGCRQKIVGSITRSTCVRWGGIATPAARSSSAKKLQKT